MEELAELELAELELAERGIYQLEHTSKSEDPSLGSDQLGREDFRQDFSHQVLVLLQWH